MQNLEQVMLGGAATQISAGNAHTCVVLVSGDVQCWGEGGFGQLGLGDMQNRGDDNGEMGPALPTVPLGERVQHVAAGLYHSCALLESGAVKCWGLNLNGQLGLGDNHHRGDHPDEMGDQLPTVDLGEPAVRIDAGETHSCALLASGAIKCWGHFDNGRLGLGEAARQDIGDGPGEMGRFLPPINVGAPLYLPPIPEAGQ
jgi:alpha-tubulin suppressor-like RCC1 family protein